MKIIETIVVFLLLLVVIAGLALPLYWDRVQPIIFNIPGYVAGIIRELKDSVGYILKNV